MIDDATPDPARIMRLARQAMSSSEYRKKFHVVDFWGQAEWYDPQLRFFAAGAKHHQRLIRGGNQTGKSWACAYEASLHITGAYPRWWTGKRFNKPTRGWVIGPERVLVRDGPQKKLTAMQGEFGTGAVPLASIVGRPIMVPGGTGSIDTMSVAHETDGARDGISTTTYKSFEQGAEKMQAESVDWIWVDERCSEEIYSELIARTTATDGIVFLSYTPLKGGGELTYRFLNDYSPDRIDIRIDAQDAKHISAERRAQHEREARIHGRPQLGIARVFPFPIESLMRAFDPDTEIQGWAKWIVGIDFGYGHPFAAALCAWVPEIDEFFVVDGFKMERSEALYHVKRIAGMCRGLRIPIAWPHDGNNHEKSSGIALADVYRRVGAPTLGKHAENKGGGYHVEPAIEEMCGFMKRGAFYIASHMSELGEEILCYHRDSDYKPVPLRDDLLSATRYAFMMRRSGKTIDGCETYGRAPGVDGAQYDPRPVRNNNAPRERFARGTPGPGLDVQLLRRKGCDDVSRQAQIGEADVVNVQGRFVWYELMTTDMVAATAFYTSVVRWGTRDASMPGMAYTLFTAAETSVSGLMILPEDAKKAGAGPRWIGYVGVSDVDATADRIKQLGGTVQVPPTDIPGISRFSIVADPQMATLALIQWLRPRQELPAAPNAAGRVGWHELLTAECDQALSFYREVFGWLKGIADIGARGTYQLFSVGGHTAGAIVTKPATVPSATWLYYFNVGDIDSAANRVKSGGGEILNGPTEVPDGSWIVQCTDPEGAIFALVGKRSSNAAGFLERVAALD